MNCHTPTCFPVEDTRHDSPTGSGTRSIGVSHAPLPESNFDLPFVQYTNEFDICPIRKCGMPFEQWTDLVDIRVIGSIDENRTMWISGRTAGNGKGFSAGLKW